MPKLGCGFHFRCRSAAHERRGAMAVAHVKGARAPMFFPLGFVTGVRQLVRGVPFGEQVEHVLHDFARSREHGVHHGRSDVWQKPPHSVLKNNAYPAGQQAALTLATRQRSSNQRCGPDGRPAGAWPISVHVGKIELRR